MKKIVTLIFILNAYFCFAQMHTVNDHSGNIQSALLSKPEKYWIYLTDKSGSPFTKTNPSAYLSQRAIDRRERYHIGISASDLPVSTLYLEQLRNTGIVPVVTSRWLNAVSAYLTDEQIAEISALPFVKDITRVKKYSIEDKDAQPLQIAAFYKTGAVTDIEGVYGFAETQITQINLDTVLELGFTGDSMVIAVIDAGFLSADTAALFQSFWDKEQILGYYNFPDHNDQVFNITSGIHGSWVMSVIGGDIPDAFSGSSPDAKFYLFRTEVAENEHVVEEDYWLAAAERADSVGADVINSSLGYTTFDDGIGDHTYADLNGNTSVVTNAADMAAQKGILVCNSAGNEGDNDWHYVSMPSDGDSVFSIGAVNSSGLHAAFSGFGPTSDGRIKPNVVALGEGSAVLNPDGTYGWLNGTSFSSPLMAGACASLWQAFPAKNNMEIIDAVERSAHLYFTPNDSMGYGIPNFGIAYEILKAETVDTIIDDSCYAYFEYTTTDSMLYNFTNLSFGSDSSEIISYFWNFCDGGISTESDPSHIYALAGLPCACLTIVDTMGCTSTYCVEGPTVSIQDETFSFNISPNPVTDDFVVSVQPGYSGNYSIHIYSVWGQDVYNAAELMHAGETTNVQVEKGANLSAGIYFIAVTGDHGMQMRKLVIN